MMLTIHTEDGYELVIELRASEIIVHVSGLARIAISKEDARKLRKFLEELG